jgi:hypothetical protein
MMRIYVTHCSAKKDETLKDTRKAVPPDRLYTATPTQRFTSKCREKGVSWAIFSDLYGVWFPSENHEWYEKDPDNVSHDEFLSLIDDFNRKLQSYDEIWFYYNPGRFHPLYGRLLEATSLKGRVRKFTHLWEID